MDKSPLVAEQIDAGACLIRAFGEKIPVHAAFWLRERDDDDWFLYLASDQINDSNFDVAYGEVLRLSCSQQNQWLDPFQVKVTGLDDAVAKAALDVMKKCAGRIPTRYHGRSFGGLSVQEVYIYPIPIAASA